MVKYAGNCRLGRRFLNRIFGRVNKRPDAECWVLERFVLGTVEGCDVDCSISLQERNFLGVPDGGNVLRFHKETGAGHMWQHWFEHKANGWPVVEKQGDRMVWTWFRRSRQMGDWVALGQSCPLVYQLVEREDGKGFNKVRIELVSPSYEV